MIDIFLFFYLFIIFTPFGSFFGVVLERVMRDENPFKGRSYCLKCKRKLKYYDLIPIFSFIFLKGKCRYCKKLIQIRLFLFEVLAGTTLAIVNYPIWIVYLQSHTQVILIGAILYSLFVSILLFFTMLIFVTDIQYRLIPDIYIYILLFNYVLFKIIDSLNYSLFSSFRTSALFFSGLSSHIYGALLMFISFMFLHLVTHKKGMGVGDVLLSTVLGLYVGLRLSVVMWFISFLTGSVIGVTMILIKGRGKNKYIPFGPFLILGMLISLILGEDLIQWYLSLGI